MQMTKRIDGFYKLCKIGNLPDIIEYVELHHITAEEARSEYNSAFRYACEYGHLDVAQWLVRRFGLAAKDDINGNYIFRRACEKGYLDLARWLADYFNLTIENARYDVNYAFHYACEKGRLHIAQWLIKHFGLTKENIWNRVNTNIVDQLDWEPLGPKSAVKLT